MSDSDPEIERSPLSRDFTRNDVTVQVEIYRLVGSGSEWTLEVVDEEYASTVWDETFATDQAAFSAFLNTVDKEGIRTFLCPPAQPQLH